LRFLILGFHTASANIAIHLVDICLTLLVLQIGLLQLK
jgi:hypothetical protein